MSKDLRKLVIDEGSEFKIKVEKLEDFDKSFFKDIYDSAAVNVKEILDNTEQYYNKKNEKKFFKDKEESNNIIAFAGERGTGKSSVMISFAESLKTIEKSKIDLDKEEFVKFNDLKGVSFVKLDIIDPALLEDKESIFEIVIAKMFSKFKEHLEKEDETLEFDDKKRLLKKFQKVYKDLKVINTDRKDFFKESTNEDILQTLVSLASGSNMRNSFMRLVNEYLQFFSTRNDNDKEKRFLVIPIDDLDMNIKHSAEMAEQIRKYLMVPNVIILMAIKIDQLKDSIEQMYRKNYEVMLEAESLSDNPKEMAERYIEKLIPNGRKLYLPEIRATTHGKKEKIILDFNSKDDNKSDIKKYDEFEDIEDAVLGMTYRKTGLIFIKPAYSMNYLVPDNLRELQNYLIMLNKMEDVDLNGDGSSNYIRIKNIKKFETYFLKTWVKMNLGKVYIDLIKEFYNINLAGKNKYIVTEMKNIISQPINEDIQNQIFDSNNNHVNISIGDVLKVFTINKDYDSSQIRKFKFAIKTIYSIIISELLYTGDNSISVLIGGNIFGDFGGAKTLLDLKNYPDIIINNNMSASYIVGDIVDIILEKIQKDDKDDKDESKLENNIKLLECFNYFIYITPDEVKSNYRLYDEAYYDIISNLGCGKIEIRNAKFDMLAFVFFLINPIGNLEKIFSGRIENKLDSKEYFKVDGSIITKDDLLKEIKKYSMFDTIESWEKKYKVALPIYSLDILEHIGDRLKKILKNKIKKRTEQYYNNIFKRMFTAVLPEIINDIKKDNGFLLHENEASNKICLFEEAYNNCPIIKLVSETMDYQSNNEVSEIISFETVINNAYIKSDQALKNLDLTSTNNEEQVAILLEALNNNRNYFMKWSKKIVSAYRLRVEVKQLLGLGSFLDKDTEKKFVVLKERLDEILKDHSKDLEATRIEIVQLGLDALDKEIDRIEKTKVTS